jgi:hypothetical protein
MRAYIPLLATFLVSGCARPSHGHIWPTHLLVFAGAQPGFMTKVIVDKQKPATLVADDGSICRTSAERFTRTAVGKWIACNWTLPDPNIELARAEPD